ncbi:MAG: DUF4199 family protein [Weeksellaceae bacterium]|nr:DUF4199 family protein [Weeksellaceae bacterium]
MFNSRISRTSINLYLAIIIIFLLVQLLFRGREFFDLHEYQFLQATAIANAFLVTFTIAIFTAHNVWQASKNPNYSFLSVFKLAFLPAFLAGSMAIISVFAYYHFIDPIAIDQLKHEYLDHSLLQAKGIDNYDEVVAQVNSPEVRGFSLLNFRTFTFLLFALLFFCFSLSLMFSFLWKVKNTSS